MTNSDKVIVEKLNQFILNNLDNPNFSIEEISAELALSRSQLFRIVKEYSDLSPSLYIRKIKLQKGKELLDNDDLKIAEIAYKVGIDSPQSFTKYFLQEFGVNPTDYRKKRIESNIEVIDSEEVIDIEPKIKLIKKTNSYLYFGIGLGLILLIGLGFYFWKKKSSESVTNSLKNNSPTSIIILPFKNLGSSENALFADGLMSQVHSSLSQINSIKVISKSSALLFKDSKKTIQQIAQEISVSHVLSGTVLQSQNKVKVTIELIKGDEDRTIWSKSFDGEITDAIGFMNRVAKEVANELFVKLSNSDSKKMDKVPTENLEAYNLYLEGLELVKSRLKDKLNASLSYFDRAIDLDPNFADAYAAKASVYFIMYGYDFIEPDLSVKMAEKYALDAIRLDENNATAYAVLAGSYKNQFKWEQAVTTFQIALKHNPNDAQIYYWYSLTLRSIGELEMAVEYSKKAADLDPLSAIIYAGYINSCTYAGKFDLAKEAIDKKELIFDNHYMYFFVRGIYHLNKSEYKEAIAEFNQADKLNKNYSVSECNIAYCQAKLGQNELAQAFIKNQTQTPLGYHNMAFAYAGLGDKEQCLKYLWLAAEGGELPEYFKISPVFKFLHGEKRYEELLQKFGLLNVAPPNPPR